MTIQPQLAVTGYRGIWGETLTEDIVRRFTKAFTLFTKENTKKERPTILIGRDGRANGLPVKEAVILELNSLGAEIIDGDILPTPTVLFAVHRHKYDGAIIITASHNPIEYNGLKFVTKEARLTNESEVAIIKKYYDHS